MRATGRTGMRAARRKRSRSYQVTPGAPDPRRETLKMRVTASSAGHAIRVEGGLKG